ncbi:MAG TPA: tetratricopeptide repeat protein [Geminicoccus sp.]|jgi:tetratricopeptide (TPR) repeat protein|uniref:tetratricopeptide repeat protein n=1 Tax=Geminicoccus sp. TaxID=2024832 RepID=UPI002E2F27D6|nr:tetratricopeptide repeat protein [Geminicoccus sp.]HEX2527949.1 tetratricopeptide repeat protein [Geminicoccus sp.]
MSQKHIPLLREAQVALGAGQAGRAVRHLRQALQYRPADPDVLSLLAVALFEAGEPAAALEAARRATVAGPASARAHYNRAVLLRRTGDPEAALEELAQVLELAPDHPAARVEQAQSLVELGRLLPAVRALADHRRTFPDDVEAVRDLAIFAERAGDWATAADAWAALAGKGSDSGEAEIRLVAVLAEQHGSAAASTRVGPREADRPQLRHALDKALSHAGRGMLRLRPQQTTNSR